jgi:hypothetical protein
MILRSNRVFRIRQEEHADEHDGGNGQSDKKLSHLRTYPGLLSFSYRTISVGILVWLTTSYA